MLTELRIENFAIIDRQPFQAGLITFTGEPGRQSIIIVRWKLCGRAKPPVLAASVQTSSHLSGIPEYAASSYSIEERRAR
jgi:DNA repair ATPase RecN